MAQPILLHVFIDEYLNICKKSDNYKTSLQNAGNHLQTFSLLHEIPIFTNLNEQTIEDFAYYLQDRNLKLSTVKNNITRIKYLIKKARKAGYKTDLAIDDFVIQDEEANAIFLTMREILKIHRYTDLTKREIEI